MLRIREGRKRGRDTCCAEKHWQAEVTKSCLFHCFPLIQEGNVNVRGEILRRLIIKKVKRHSLGLTRVLRCRASGAAVSVHTGTHYK